MIVWPVMILAGLFAGAIPPLLFEVPAELPHLSEEDIETEDVAGASGIMTSLQSFGGFFLPSFVLVPISSVLDFNAFFLVSSVFIGLPAVAVLLVREVGEV